MSCKGETNDHRLITRFADLKCKDNMRLGKSHYKPQNGCFSEPSLYAWRRCSPSGLRAKPGCPAQPMNNVGKTIRIANSCVLSVAKTLKSSANVDFSVSSAKVGPLCSMSFRRFCGPWSLASDPIPGSCLKIWRSAINSPCSNGRHANPNSSPPTDYFGLACCASGHAGSMPWASSNPKPSSLGIAAAFASSGDGNPRPALEGPPSTATSSR